MKARVWSVGAGVGGLEYLAEVGVGELGVDLRRGDVGVAQQLLHVADGGAASQHVGGEGVAQGVRRHVRLDAGVLGVVLEDEPEALAGQALATLAGGLSSHRPELVDGVGLILGIDRFMSEARALTNFAGNAIATVVIGQWTGSIDRAQLDRVLSGQDPFDETTMVDDGHGDAVPSAPEPVRDPAPVA